MTPQRKPRSDAVLLNLPEEKRLEVYKLVRALGFAKAKQALKKDHKITASIGALHNFYKHASEEYQRQRLIKAATDSDAVRQSAKQLGNLEDALLSELTQKAFELMVAETPDTDAVRDVINCVLQLKRQELSERSLALEQDKFRNAIKSSVEKGLDALYAEIKRSPAAVKLFQKLRETALKGVDEAV